MTDARFTGRLFTHAGRLIRFMNILSLDVVAGALLSSAFAAALLEVRPAVPYWMVLGMSVWIIYTADHLVDAYRLGDASKPK